MTIRDPIKEDDYPDASDTPAFRGKKKRHIEEETKTENENETEDETPVPRLRMPPQISLPQQK